ncbi:MULTISPECIES: hypothetical protein [Paraburkholderia]|uniref:hypothetical protein n=1 Tax=Paraburkholderia TaxID=1822464 RepID=UPI00224D71C3|nr:MULTISPECIES: hypothetical protein [Paraburkholderia]MCX4166290.1 hypothetical protein [Paraburkholderia megapolitana]MDN7161780.1 hypothetical protein [Paraburkholderia sp. CHISQ3]MDQ6498828.1 hypothetical protein [Paraburkholderia megapolitana]
MNGRGFITISMHELERVKVIEAVIEHGLTLGTSFRYRVSPVESRPSPVKKPRIAGLSEHSSPFRQGHIAQRLSEARTP